MTDSSPRPVTIVERAEVFRDKPLRVVRSTVQYERSDGAQTEQLSRLAVIPGDAVSLLLYDPRADLVLLVRQFRYPLYERLAPDASDTTVRAASWLLEVVAGKQDAGESVEETARRELREETGYELTSALERIATIYPSPGTSAEQITLFLAEIDSAGSRGAGGGVDAGEDTELVQLPRAQALAMIQTGELRDAKTVISLQYLALRRS